MRRALKSIIDIAAFLGALGVMALFCFLLIQAVMVGLATVVGLLFASFQSWGSGLLAGIITYSVLMKLAWYLDIFDMISTGRTSRTRSESKKTNPS